MLATVVAAVVLKGIVTIGPVTPVCRVGVPCDRPAAHVVLTFNSGGRAVRTTTSASGTYVVKLVPGSYTVRSSAGMRIAPERLTVRAAGRRDFAIDTGIR
jgi:hypothetical protein